MTVTLVYGDSADGYLTSFDASYSNSRNGPADTASVGTVAWYGQNNNGGTYTTHQTFLRFAYVQPAATDVVVSAAIRTTQASQISTGTERHLELRGYTWSAGGLTTGDWRTPAQLEAAVQYGRVVGVQAAAGKNTYAGSEALRALIPLQAYVELVLVSSRQRIGFPPTTDEGSSIYATEQNGTAQDPLLIFTTAPRHDLMPGHTAEAQLSDGSWVFLTVDGNTVTLWREDLNGLAYNLGAHVMGTGSGQWSNVPAAQGFALTVDDQDNIYVVGRAGDAGGSIRLRAWVKTQGSWSWTAGTMRTAALASHDAPINNLTAAWHPTAGGTLVVFASRVAGEGWVGGAGTEMVHVLMDSTYLRTGAGSLVRASGFTKDGLLPASGYSTDFNSYTNETGTGLDVVADRFQRDWGYLVTYDRSVRLGDNNLITVARYCLSSTGGSFVHASYDDGEVWARKDASSKVRILNVGTHQVAVVTADADTGYGLTVTVLQSQGTTAGWVKLGSVALAGEGIPSMPSASAVASTATWDAIYSPGENAVWVYYVDASTGGGTRLMRTSVDLDTYQATRVEKLIWTHPGSAIRSVRAPRNAWPGVKTHVTVAGTPSGYARVIDTLNLPPLAPTLTPKSNYDATTTAFYGWTFQDPNGSGDAQSAYQLQVERVSDGVTVVDTGKVASSSEQHTIPGGVLTNGQDYRWRVRTWDAADLEGPWSAYGTFTTSAGGSVTITTPAVDNPSGVITDDFQVSWTVADTVQAKYHIWVTRNDTGATVYDSGWVVSAATSHAVTGMVSDVEHTIRVVVQNAAGVSSGVGSRLITPSYGTPEVPLVTAIPIPAEGYVLITVDNPVPGEPAAVGPLWDMEPGTDLAPWYKSAATLELSTEQVYRGTQSAKLTALGGSSQAYVRAPALIITPGQRYATRTWLWTPVARDLRVEIEWLTSSAVWISTTSTQLPVPANTWTLLTASGVAPADAARASYGFSIRNTPAAGDFIYGEDTLLYPASDRPEVVRNVIFSRPAGSQGPWTRLGECGPDGSFRDYAAPSHVPMEYMVRGESA